MKKKMFREENNIPTIPFCDTRGSMYAITREAENRKVKPKMMLSSVASPQPRDRTFTVRARRERFLAGRRAKTDVSLHRFEIVKVNYHGRFLASEERKKKRGEKKNPVIIRQRESGR